MDGSNIDGGHLELKSLFWNGWGLIKTQATRTGNYTFTLVGDMTGSIGKGTRVKYKESGSYEYGVVISATYSSPNTTVTLATNSDYAMAGNPTELWISHGDPPDYPDGFNYTVVFSATSTMTFESVTTNIGKFWVHGRLCTVAIRGTGSTAGTADSGPKATLPIAPDDGSTSYIIGAAVSSDGSNVMSGTAEVSASSVIFRRYDFANWTLGASRFVSVVLSYGF